MRPRVAGGGFAAVVASLSFGIFLFDREARTAEFYGLQWPSFARQHIVTAETRTAEFFRIVVGSLALGNFILNRETRKYKNLTFAFAFGPARIRPLRTGLVHVFS